MPFENNTIAARDDDAWACGHAHNTTMQCTRRRFLDCTDEETRILERRTYSKRSFHGIVTGVFIIMRAIMQSDNNNILFLY